MAGAGSAKPTMATTGSAKAVVHGAVGCGGAWWGAVEHGGARREEVLRHGAEELAERRSQVLGREKEGA